MKKLLSMMLALLMLALPVFSGAETVTVTAATLLQGDYMSRYILQGQKMTADYSMELSDTFFSMAGADENIQAALRDLMSVLSFRITGQTDGSKAQGGMAVLLSGEEVLSAKTALIEKNLYATSNLLGGKVLQVTPAQIKELAKKLLNQMVEQGAVTQEQADSLIRFYQNLRKDPAGTIMSLIGQPDFAPLQTALTAMISEVKTEEVTEAPAELPGAVSVITVPVKKEALTNVTTELAKLIWSLPVVQKLAPSLNGAPKSEEEMVAAFNKLPDALAEDTEVKIFADDSENIFITSDLKVNKNGEVADVSYRNLMTVKENGLSMDYTMTVPDAVVHGVMDIATRENGVSVSYRITADAEEDGKAWQAVDETVNLSAEQGENTRSITMDVTMRVKETADSETVGVVMKGAQTTTDLGDHAAETGEVTIGIDGQGDLMTFRIAAETGAAEEYIATADTIQPLAMTGEELAALGEEAAANAQQLLAGAMDKLPESVMKLLTGQ